MRIHLLRACAAALTLALGLAALPAAGQNNNVAFNRRLSLSDPARASAQVTDTTVRPAAATQTAASQTTARNETARGEVVAADSPARQPMTQPVARPISQPTSARAANAAVVAAMPMPAQANVVAPTTRDSTPQYVPTPPVLQAAPVSQAVPAPLAVTRVAEPPRTISPQATVVHNRRAFGDEPRPVVESTNPSMVTSCGDPTCNGCDDCDCDDCGGDGWFGGGLRRGSGRWLAGVEFLFARPHFSEATAYILHQNQTLGPGNLLTASDTYVHHNFDYEPSARGYIAYRLDECCAELRGTYTRLQSDSSRSASPDANATIVPTYFEVQPAPGDTLTSTADVGGDVFDVDFSRCIRAGGECIPCDCRTCPDWDLSWSAGARLARWDLNGDVFTTDPTDGRLDIDQEFIGAGPKIGLEGKRYFGRYQQFSIYSSFDASLLVGWYEYRMDRSIPSIGVNPATQETFISKVTRTIPVTEIELGVKWQPYERLNLSAGWFFQAWWDLGMSTQQPSNLLGGIGPQFLLDDSNIMSWDGLTVRAELSF